MTAVLLVAALALDVALIFAAAGTAGFAARLGPVRLTARDPGTALIAASLILAGLVVVAWNKPYRNWVLALTAGAVAAIGCALARGATPMFPLGDTAVLEIYVREALAGRLLDGPYSRFGFHHPGPLYFYLMAPLYVAGGANTAALTVGAAAVTVASIALVVWMVNRSAGAGASAGVVAALALLAWRLPDLTNSPWNAHVIVFPAVALVCAAAGAAGGDLPLLPLVAGLASFVVQTDVALAPVASAIALGAVAAAAAARWPSDRAMVKTWLNRSAWLALAAWIVPAAEEIARSPGNFTLLWRFFATSGGGGSHTQTMGNAVAAWAAMLSSPFTGSLTLATGRAFVSDSSAVALLLAFAQLAGVGGVAVWAWRTRHGGLARLASTSIVAAIVALWSVTRIADQMVDHQVFWLCGFGALNAGIIAAGAMAWLTERQAIAAPRWLPAVAHATLLAIVAAVVLGQLDRARAGHIPATLGSSIAGRAAEGVRTFAAERQAKRLRVHIGDDVWGFAAGVLVEMDRAGVAFSIEPGWASMFPGSFRESGAEDAVLMFGPYDAHLEWIAQPGTVLVGNSATVYVDARLK